MSPAARPPVGYAEVAEFHVAIARREDPSLLERPVVVGGDPDKRGKVVAASASLRERGIVDGMGVAEALDRAPEARWVRTDMGRAREVSGSLRAAVRREVEAVELEGLRLVSGVSVHSWLRGQLFICYVMLWVRRVPRPARDNLYAHIGTYF